MGDPLSVATTLPPDGTIASLWRRLIAFIADAVLLAIPAILVSIPFFDPLSRLGVYGPIVGFGLAFPYFAILNSRIGNGQTLGKKWMRIQVIDEEGKTISFRKSSIRYMVFAVPYYLDNFVFPTTRTPWLVSSLVSLIVTVVGGVTIYLVLFNRRTRQGLHDLTVGSYVVDADKLGPLAKRSIWKGHWAILGTLFLLVYAGGAILGKKLSAWGSFPQLLEDVRLIEAVRGVQAAGVQDLTSFDSSADTKKKILVANVRWTGRADQQELLANQIAMIILQKDPNAGSHDSLRIVIIRGYDLGIAHAEVSRFFEHSPAEWNQLLSGNPSSSGTPAGSD
jgi:uncharacterized RDD family membrane protein YckC